MISMTGIAWRKQKKKYLKNETKNYCNILTLDRAVN